MILSCPHCNRGFELESDNFCVICFRHTPHYSHLANRLNGGNNYLQCSVCGCETTEESSKSEFKKFVKDKKNYKAPESY